MECRCFTGSVHLLALSHSFLTCGGREAFSSTTISKKCGPEAFTSIPVFMKCGGREAFTSITIFRKCGGKTSSGGQECHIL